MTIQKCLDLYVIHPQTKTSHCTEPMSRQGCFETILLKAFSTLGKEEIVFNVAHINWRSLDTTSKYVAFADMRSLI